MTLYKRDTSTEAARTGATLTGIIGVTNAALRPSGNTGNLIVEDATLASYTGQGANLMEHLLAARDTLASQAPGRKVAAVLRNAYTQMQEARNASDSAPLYPSLQMNDTYGGMAFVPVDVGFEALAANTFYGVIMDWGANAEHVVSDREVFVDPYTERGKGNHRFILDGKSGYVWRDRFGIAVLQA